MLKQIQIMTVFLILHVTLEGQGKNDTYPTTPGGNRSIDRPSLPRVTEKRKNEGFNFSRRVQPRNINNQDFMPGTSEVLSVQQTKNSRRCRRVTPLNICSALEAEFLEAKKN